MKKVKIMLSAILVMAVVAGAMAFNAKKKTNFCLFTYQASPEKCVLAGNATTTISPFGATTLATIVDKGTANACSDLAVPAASVCNQEIRTIAE